MKLHKGDKLVFIGDSITDAGRAQPHGEGLFDALGRGYVAQVDALLGAVYPELGIRIINKGTGGHTVRDLKARWQTDVLDLKPDWLVVMIGINDVWRQYDSPRQPEGHVFIEEYELTLADLIAQARGGVKGLVLMTPFYIEPSDRDAMRATMDKYGRAVERIARKNSAVFVDTQAAFNKVLEHVYAATLAWDRVHPGQPGHMILARSFLQAMDFDWR